MKQNDRILQDKPFTRALLARHEESIKSTLRWVGAKRNPRISEDLSTAVLTAIGSTANEISYRAARRCGLPILLPDQDPTAEQEVAIVFGMLVTLGLFSAANAEGIELKGADVGPAYVSAWPLHSLEEKSELGSRAARSVQLFVEHASDFASNLFTLAKIYVHEVPATEPERLARFKDGSAADELFASMLSVVLESRKSS